MNFRDRSKRFGKWAIIKYQGNMAYYAVCQNCRYGYPCYKIGQQPLYVEIDEKQLHKYCPNCGLKMKELDTEHFFLFSMDGEHLDTLPRKKKEKEN